MDLIRNVSIKTRLTLAMVVMSLALVGLGAGGYLAISRAQADFGRFAGQHLPLVVAVNRSRQALGQLARFEETDVAMNYSLPSEAERLGAQWQELYGHALDSLQHAQGISGSGHTELRDGRAALLTYEGKVRPVFAAAAQGRLQSASEGKRALDGVKRHVKDAEDLLAGLGRQLDADAHVLAAEITVRNDRSRQAVAIVVPACLLLLLPLMWATLRSIVGPLQQARAIASTIARGELTAEVPTTGRDETADLLRSLSEMQAGLRRLVGGIRDAASFVATASRQIAAANRDLSERTEKAASGLEAASKGVSLLNGQLTESSQSAMEAESLAAGAAQATQEAGTKVGEVAHLMEEIANSSTQIAEITDVVNGIALRTRILAINAGVEAARAGEQGRGFAVVAEEVRTLAQRVTDSAREIRTLIDSSTARVARGAERVKEAGCVMGKVIDSSRSVSRGVQQISTAATEQSGEMEHMAKAVTALDRLSQQNSALVQESAAAAAGLREQADRLQALVGKFKLE